MKTRTIVRLFLVLWAGASQAAAPKVEYRTLEAALADQKVRSALAYVDTQTAQTAQLLATVFPKA